MQANPKSASKASKTAAEASAFGGKPPAGNTPAASSKKPQALVTARDSAHKAQLTDKLEKSSSTPLVEVVAGSAL